jgi:hypothetical protein
LLKLLPSHLSLDFPSFWREGLWKWWG